MSNNPPIQMPNLRLAHAMITAGIPFAQMEEGACQNHYTPNLLRDKRILGDRPITHEQFEKLVLETAERGVPGSAVFFFERTKEAEDMVKAWDETVDAIKALRAWAKLSPEEQKVMDAPNPIDPIEATTIAKVLCIHANNAETVKTLPFINAPICNTLAGQLEPRKSKLGNDQVTATGVAAGETKGAGKVWSTNLSNADRAEIKLEHNKIREWKNPYAKNG